MHRHFSVSAAIFGGSCALVASPLTAVGIVLWCTHLRSVPVDALTPSLVLPERRRSKNEQKNTLREQHTPTLQHVPSQALCFRADVQKTQVVALQMPFGTPLRKMTLLLRMDVVAPVGEPSVVLESPMALESRTLQCSSATPGLCVDRARVDVGLRAPLSQSRKLVPMPFVYARHLDGRVEEGGGLQTRTDGLARALGFDGELRLVRGRSHHQTRTHHCVFTDGSTTKHPLKVPQYTGFVKFNRVFSKVGVVRGLMLNDPFVAPEGCANDTRLFLSNETGGVDDDVRLFPVEAAVPMLWMCMDRFTSESGASPHQFLVHRRRIRDAAALLRKDPSVACKARVEIMLLRRECEAQGVTLHPSLPLHDLVLASPRENGRGQRTALRIQMRVEADDSVHWSVRKQPRAVRTDDDDEYTESAVQLVLVLLTTVVVWLRANKTSASLTHLLHTGVRVIGWRRLPPQIESSHAYDWQWVAEDALVGLVAWSVRALVVLYWKFSELRDDEQHRVVWVQIVAVVASATLWFARYGDYALSQGAATLHSKKPLVHLGGSSALADVTCSVVVAFSTSPLFAAGASAGFDTIARCLVAIVMVFFPMRRAIISLAACVVHTGVLRANRRYQRLQFEALDVFKDLVLASTAVVVWMVQFLAMTVAIVDLVAAPLAYDILRVSPPGVDERDVAALLCLLLITFSMPGYVRSISSALEVRESLNVVCDEATCTVHTRCFGETLACLMVSASKVSYTPRKGAARICRSERAVLELAAHSNVHRVKLYDMVERAAQTAEGLSRRHPATPTLSRLLEALDSR